MYHRRDILRHLSFGTGAVLLHPLLNQVRAQAAGQPAPPRFVFILEGNGLPWQQITPAAIQRSNQQEQRTETVDLSLEAMELPQSLQPVAAFKKKMTIVNGLSGRVAGGGHSNDFGALGIFNAGGVANGSGNPAGETVDVALGKHLGGIHPHIGLGMIENPSQAVVYNCSAWDKGKPMPTICDPDAAYRNLFGVVAEGNASKRFRAQVNVLDFLRDDLFQLQKEVAGPEQEKLESHLGAYEAMRDRQSRLNEIKHTLREHAPVVHDKYSSKVETDRLDAQFDIAAAALSGGLTNVVTIASGVGSPYFGVTFTGLGIHYDKHGIGHMGSYNGWSWDEMAVMIRGFHFELIARLLNKLATIPEGNGTMLDNTTVIYMSDAAEAHHSRCFEWPILMIGDAGGRLRAGRYVEYPYWGNKGHRELGSLFATLLHVVGDARLFFGMRDPMLAANARSDGPLPELMADRR